jgi:5'-nucleotidase
VQGFPADTVRVALDDLHLRPTLTVSGINRGQNVGPLVAISGTVGAARAAAARGMPAIAVSQGTPGAGGQFDYDVGADLTVQEVQKLLTSARGGSSDTATIANLNVPSCDRGQVRGLRMLPPASALNPAVLGPSDCTSTANPADEVTAFHDGFAVETRVPTRP